MADSGGQQPAAGNAVVLLGAIAHGDHRVDLFMSTNAHLLRQAAVVAHGLHHKTDQAGGKAKAVGGQQDMTGGQQGVFSRTAGPGFPTHQNSGRCAVKETVLPLSSQAARPWATLSWWRR